MHVLVTGAAGFIGSHLAERLLGAGHRVTGIDDFDPYYERAIKEANLAGFRDHGSFRLCELDLAQADLGEAVDGIDAVVHLAAVPGVRGSWGAQFGRYLDNNILATQRLLEAVRARPLGIFVYGSSASIYGDAAVDAVDETWLPAPYSPYGVTKLAAEHLGRLYWKSSALPVVSLRYFTVYGPRQRPDMAFHRFLSAARDGKPLRVFGDGEQTRDFTFVADAVAATRAAGEKGRAGTVYNVGGGERVSLNDVLRRIEDVTGRRLAIVREAAQKGDMRDTFADTSRARAELGFRSTVPLDEGLRREWAWIRETP
jgi:UDP-glucose 4-epimerase